ncbi:hypothetical protein EHI8A_146240 [Entamoeba histolytica HM-1:IMSS-B]|uniref:Uncharacterized protein n=3 Tax=Entamoeba histolytica TaxID=5759 RepID=M3UIB9_ENTH1|nr:hypothetical protein EHI8A_146240 [Entamoeba histolytica HM-1:IMSS-B]EMS14021.1 hypothetical protein KM1_286450 [Entamoeba histolytica HM-3:IMSS]ENY61296.1 unknown protein, putative [Entamoeba histolytica HM-1:IMSS-A]
MHNNYDKRNNRKKGFRKRRTQRKTNKKQGKYNDNKHYTNKKSKWLTTNEIEMKNKRITRKWEKGEYSEIIKKYEGKEKKWYNILQEVYSIRKKKTLEKIKEEIKGKPKDWKSDDIKTIEEEIKNKNRNKEMNDRCKYARIINEKENKRKTQDKEEKKEEEYNK